jgi:hypothetical protein
MTRITPFPWYKMPMLPVFFLTAGYGAAGMFWRNRGKKGSAAAKWVISVAIVVFIAAQLFSAKPFVLEKANLYREYIEKELILKSMAHEIRRQAGPAFNSSILVGEVGVIGYRFMNSNVIDGSGINSKDIYYLRIRDWQRFKSDYPDERWDRKWWGSARWVEEALEKFEPKFIASDNRYLHLEELSRDPEFQRDYKLIRKWRDSTGHTFVLYQKRGGG